MCSPVAQKSLRDAVSSPEVPPQIEAVLCLYAKHHPEDALGIEIVLGFRKRVRAEFDRLVRESEKLAPVAVAGRPCCSASQLARLTP
jgi:hypothetical protein